VIPVSCHEAAGPASARISNVQERLILPRVWFIGNLRLIRRLPYIQLFLEFL